MRIRLSQMHQFVWCIWHTLLIPMGGWCDSVKTTYPPAQDRATSARDWQSHVYLTRASQWVGCSRHSGAAGVASDQGTVFWSCASTSSLLAAGSYIPMNRVTSSVSVSSRSATNGCDTLWNSSRAVTCKVPLTPPMSIS